MFQISATSKDGCPARRCVAPVLEHAENEHGLCGRHFGEWIGFGKPALVAAEPKAPREPRAAKGTALALAGEVPAEVSAKIEIHRNTARQALEMCRAFVIESQDDMDTSAAIMAKCKKDRKELEATRDFLLAPHKEGTKRVKQLCDPPIEFYESCEKALKSVQAKFLLAQQAEQDKALAAVAEAPRDVPVETLAVAHGVENVRTASSMSARKVWRVVSVDRERLLRERPDLMIPDMKAIEALVREHGADCDIPGVRLEPDLVMINRG